MRVLVCIAVLLSVSVGLGQTQEEKNPVLSIEDAAPKRVEVMVSSSKRVMSFGKRVERIDGHNPKVITVNALSPNELSIFGLNPGVTSVVVTDESGKTQHFEVTVVPDTRQIEATIKRLYPTLNLELVGLNGSALVLRGTVQSDSQRRQVQEVCETFYDQVLNHLIVKGPSASRTSKTAPARDVVTIDAIDEAWPGKEAPITISQKKFLGEYVEIRSTIDGEKSSVCGTGMLVGVMNRDGKWTAQIMVDPDVVKHVVYAKDSGRQLALFHRPLRVSKTAAAPPSRADQHASQKQIQELHSDVKRLIKLLEERKAARK